MDNAAAPTVALDFQSIYAALLLLERTPDGRYPERLTRHEYVLPLVEYVRRAALTGAALMEIDVALTNSDGSALRRAELLNRLAAGAGELVIDPGREVVEARLSIDGTLSDQCGKAVSRWYGRK
jgi:hypothetical protein